MLFGKAHELPSHLKPKLKKAKRLCWITIAFLGISVALMIMLSSNSQLLKTAWVENLLSMLPSVSFLIGAHFHARKPDHHFPYGKHRSFSISFLTASVALLSIGLFILIDSVMSLVEMHRPNLGIIVLFGMPVWKGWILIAILFVTGVISHFIGQAKMPLAKALHNKNLYTDADTQSADKRTAITGIIGMLLVGYGIWWADAVVAIIISTTVVKEGAGNTKNAVLDLMDRHPMKVGRHKEDELVEKITDRVRSKPWISEARVRAREEGQVYFAEVFIIPKNGDVSARNCESLAEEIRDMHWRLHDISIVPVQEIVDVKDADEERPAGKE
jgi:cation diffusion facilitator family transporter